MTPERYRQLCKLFGQAQPLASDERAAFVRSVAVNDPDLGADLEKLLADDEQARGGWSRRGQESNPPRSTPAPFCLRTTFQ
jgi:hypothetical protein